MQKNVAKLIVGAEGIGAVVLIAAQMVDRETWIALPNGRTWKCKHWGE